MTQPKRGGYSRYVLFILMIAFALNIIDRQILNIVAERIKEDLGLRDWQIGLMSGLAFAVFYAALGVPIARYAEHGNRAKIIGVAIFTWSIFTATCGMAANFIQLALARVGVGAGEGGFSPAASSLISDYVSKEKRSSAFATYYLGVPIGAFFGLAIGGVLADWLGWRWVFIVMGVPGLLLAIVIWTTIRDPRSTSEISSSERRQQLPSFVATLAYLKDNKSFLWLAVAAVTKGMIVYGQGPFISSFFLRNHSAEVRVIADAIGGSLGLQIGTLGLIGITLGLSAGIFGMIGTITGGAVGDRAAAKKFSGQLSAPAWATLILVPIYCFGLITQSAILSFACLALSYCLSSIWYGPLYAVVQSIVPANMRATTSAILFLLINLIGIGFGPLAVGVTSDILNEGVGLGPGEGLRWALVLSTLIGLLSSYAFFRARSAVDGDHVS